MFYVDGLPTEKWEIKIVRRWFIAGNDLDPANIDSYFSTV